jgi:hypothetical protein
MESCVIGAKIGRPYPQNEVPDYAILSHRWNTEDVTFTDIGKAPISELQSQTRTKKWVAKIQGICKLALNDGYAWIWIDGCCMDKSSCMTHRGTLN